MVLSAVLLPGATPEALAQGFLSPGARAIPPVGQQSAPAEPATPVPATLAPPSLARPPGGRPLPSIRLQEGGAPTAPAMPDGLPDGGQGVVQRPRLPGSRPVPPPPALPPADAAAQLRAMVELAWTRNPELVSAPARRAAATARAAAAGSVTPAPPSAGGGFVTDGFNNRRGGREMELSLATPLWLPGEGTASVRAADAATARLGAQGEALRLAVAGEVREALAAVALAQVELAGAEARLRDAATLEGDIARRVRGRDAAESELLAARLDRLEAEVVQRERRALLDGARLSFATLTGVEPNPAALNEQAPGGAARDEPGAHPRLAHPRLMEAEAAISAAEANRRLAGLQVRDSPEIGVIGRSERDPGSNRYDTRAGLQFRLPFATEARNAPRRAAAEAELTEAMAAAANLQRQVTLQVAQARMQLEAVEAGLQAARQRVGVLRQQRTLSEAAYRAGQVGLADAIRVRAVVTESEVAQGRAEIAVRQGRSRIRQAMGLLP